VPSGIKRGQQGEDAVAPQPWIGIESSHPQRKNVVSFTACAKEQMLPRNSLHGASRQLRGSLRGHTASLRAVAFSADGAMLASGSYNGTAKLWDLATGLEYAALTDHTATIDAIALSPDGKTLATASRDQTVRLWDLAPATDEEVLGSDK
jgi:WD40 repeat protein